MPFLDSDEPLSWFVEASEEVEAVVTESEICVAYEGGAVISKLVEGRFPEYESMIPRDWNSVMKVAAAPFLTAIRQASLLTSKDTMSVILRFCENLLELRTETKDVGQSRIEIPVEYGAEPLEIRFNPQFVMDFLRVVDPEATVEMLLKDPRAATLVRVGKDFRYVIMPVAPRREAPGEG